MTFPFRGYGRSSAGSLFHNLQKQVKTVSITPGGALHIFWVRGRAIGKVIYFRGIGIKNGINFHNFGIRNGTDLQDFAMKYKVAHTFSQN